MLHFPSTSTAADTARPADVLQLRALLGDHVWAFSNCRVDVPGQQIAEVDWLFYNATRGTFLVSEWKHFPSPVVTAMDEGKPWLLADGAEVPNPVEQVSRQVKAVRKALRCSIQEQHFPGIDAQSVNPYQAVYSPQVTEATQIERLRYGRVHKSLDELARTVESITGPAPLVASTPQDRLRLAESLAELFRCSISNTVRRKIAPPAPVVAPREHRVAAIHRELAALHLELASLLDAAPTLRTAARLDDGLEPQAPEPTASAPRTPHAVVVPILRTHVEWLVPPTSATSDDLRKALLAVLHDGRLRSGGLHVGLFGAVVGQRVSGSTNLRTLVPGGLRKWCVAQAGTAGMLLEPDAADPSVVRLTTAAPPRSKDVR